MSLVSLSNPTDFSQGTPQISVRGPHRFQSGDGVFVKRHQLEPGERILHHSTDHAIPSMAVGTTTLAAIKVDGVAPGSTKPMPDLLIPSHLKTTIEMDGRLSRIQTTCSSCELGIPRGNNLNDFAVCMHCAYEIFHTPTPKFDLATHKNYSGIHSG